MTKPAFTIWLTGLPASGKSTIADLLTTALAHRGWRVELLDGDAVRAAISPELGFTVSDRERHLRRVAWICALLNRHGANVVAAFVSPTAAMRASLRAAIPHFVEVYVECPAEVCARRDVKGLWSRAARGDVTNFTGVSAPYEPPTAPDIILHTEHQPPAESVAAIVRYLQDHRL